MSLQEHHFRLKRKVHKLFQWEKPYALPIERFNKSGGLTWEKWNIDTAKKYPIKYFFMETLFDKPYKYCVKIDRIINYIKCHTYRKYHLLDLRQPPGGYFQYRYGYCDVVEKMIFANFNLLIEFIEKEHGGIDKTKEYLDYLKSQNDSVNEVHIEYLSKAIELYHWWKTGLIKINDVDFDKEVNEKLKELIDIRVGLWT